jgi:pyruvate dehydrogenase E2 component (dihydrolipoamide acetyltransferase)
MSRAFVLPDLGEGLTEAQIVGVLVHEGDVIREDAPLLEVETDKAQVEIPSPMSGRVEKIHVHPGQTVTVGAVLITFSDSGDGAGAPAPAGRREAEASAPACAPAQAGDADRPARRQADALAPVHAPVATDAERPAVRASGPVPERPVVPPSAPVPATPATRRLARELGVDLRRVQGTGPGGRVTEADVRAAGAAPSERAATAARAETPAPAVEARPLAAIPEAPPLPRFEQWGPVERQPLSHLRRTIAERMTVAARLIPHVTHFDRADITELNALILRNLEPARARGVTLTLTSFLLKASALALRDHPQFNASLDPAAGQMILKRYRHLGVAVATERGLIVPVIRDVDRKGLIELARELGSLAERVRAGRATLDDLRGGTFTITNIGALGGTGAIPIINYPEVAILGVARAREEAVVRDGQIAPRLMLPITLTFDHRIADGADGARFATAIARLLEHPERLLLDL